MRLNDPHYDTGLHDVKGSPDVEQAELADETIPNFGHLHGEDDTAAEE